MPPVIKTSANKIMNRKPPTKIKKILRKEVGFGCPVPGCGRPYLEWHHFDPPWNEMNHHNPKGMIALCREHHIQADNGAFTKEQLHKFKKSGKNNWNRIKGDFNWLRNKILVHVSGNFYYNTPVPIEFKGRPLIWFHRSRDKYLLLNLDMLSASGKPRAYIRDNEWFNIGEEEDIECPPSAKRLHIKYPNGDSLKLEYFELKDIEQANLKYSGGLMGFRHVEFPVTVLEISLDVGLSNFQIIPSKDLFGKNMSGNFMINCSVGLSIS